MNNQFATQFLREDFDPAAEELVDSLRDIVDKAISDGLSAEEIKAMISKAFNINEDGAAAAPASGGNTVGGGTTDGASWDPQGPTGTGEQNTTGTRKKKHQEALGNSNCIPVEDIARVMKDFRAGEISNLFLAIMDLGSKYGLKLNEGKSHKFKVGDKVKYRGQDCEVVKLLDWGYQIKGPHFTSNVIKADVERNVSEDAPMLAHGTANISTYTKDGFTKAPGGEALKRQIKGVDVENLWDEEPAAMNESRAYSRFKKETSTRSETERMHEAVKIIHRKLEEVSKLLEFTSQMKEELSEGNDTLEYKHNTKKVFEKINKKVVEVYSKSKKLG